jgi:hypothetical protein
MLVGVDEPREHRGAPERKPLCARPRGVKDLALGAHGEDAPVAKGEGRSAPPLAIEDAHVGIEEDLRRHGAP